MSVVVKTIVLWMVNHFIIQNYVSTSLKCFFVLSSYVSTYIIIAKTFDYLFYNVQNLFISVGSIFFSSLIPFYFFHIVFRSQTREKDRRKAVEEYLVPTIMTVFGRVSQSTHSIVNDKLVSIFENVTSIRIR